MALRDALREGDRITGWTRLNWSYTGLKMPNYFYRC